MSEEDDMRAVMGFAGFGKKSAMKFDIDKLFEQTKRTARQYSQQVSAKHELMKAEAGEGGDEVEMTGEGITERHSSPESHDSDDDSDVIGPPLPPGYNHAKEGEAEDSEEEDDDDDDDDEFDKKYPLSHEVCLEHGTKPVSALGMDPAGARVVTGGYDFDVRFWDFAGMDSSLRSFRTVRPCESHQICTVQYSMTGDSVLVAAGNAQAKVLDRDGQKVMECPKGWQYNVDMAHTDGHVAMINCACWHPKIKEQFLTCSNDGSLRIWDVNNAKKQLHVIKARDKQGRKVGVCCCSFTRDGKMVAGALKDGSIQLWKTCGPFARSTLQHFGAHAHGSDTSSLCFSHDNRILVSRGGDDTLKLWDIRSFKRPINVAIGLTNLFSGTDCVFSPDEQLILTGTSVKKGEGSGKLIFFNRELKQVYQCSVGDCSVSRCLWHPKLNQIVVGCSNGNAKVYFSPKYSIRGAKLSVVKVKRKKEVTEDIAFNAPIITRTFNAPIITPHALPMFREDQGRSLKRKREKERADPLKSKAPQPPLPGKGAGGRVGSGSSLGAYVRKIAALEKVEKEKDPRAALLKYAKAASDSPYWVSPAYAGTQPKPVFQQEEDSDEET